MNPPSVYSVPSVVDRPLLLRALALLVQAAGELSPEHQAAAHELLTEFQNDEQRTNDERAKIATKSDLSLRKRECRAPAAGAVGGADTGAAVGGDGVGLPERQPVPATRAADRPRTRPARRQLTRKERFAYEYSNYS